MESNVRIFYLVDEFDRVYKQLQRPAQAVAKTTSSINLDRTLRDASLPYDEKVKRYVDELHKYLHLLDARQFVDQPTVKRRIKSIAVATERPPSKPTVVPPALTPQASLRKLRYATDIDKGDDRDDEGEEKEEVFISPPLRDKKKRKVDDADWSRYVQKGKQT